MSTYIINVYRANMTGEPSAVINNLLRGVYFDNARTVRDAWRALLKRGDTSVAAIQGKLESSSWQDRPRGPEVKYFTVLLSLLSELDPAAHKREIQRLQSGGIHPVYNKTLEAFSRRLNDKPATYIGPDVPVFIAPEIEDRAFIVENLTKWSRTPELELEGVTRIDVIASQPEQDYLGKYNLFFSRIRLTWPAEKVQRRQLWWTTLQFELTFYHEVGHHACGHIEGGQVEEQEMEAKRYARVMMRRSRPIFMRVMRILLFPLRPLIRKLTKSLRA